jgi:voltage-gated potassium channel
VQLVEREVTEAECGKSIKALETGGTGLRVYRNGRAIGFWEDGCKALQPGDVVVEIIPTAPNDSAASS